MHKTMLTQVCHLLNNLEACIIHVDVYLQPTASESNVTFN